MTRTALYRLFDTDEVLLYVGITDNVERRWALHASKKRWWPEVAKKTVEWLDDRPTAESAERHAIVEEQPLYNVVHLPGAHGKPTPSGPPPAAPWHDRVMAELRTQRRSKNWLHQRSGVARTTIDGWATQPQAPQARTVAAVAEVLNVAENEALRLAGVVPHDAPSVDEDGWVDLSGVSNEALLAEVSRRMARPELPEDDAPES